MNIALIKKNGYVFTFISGRYLIELHNYRHVPIISNCNTWACRRITTGVARRHINIMIMLYLFYSIRHYVLCYVPSYFLQLCIYDLINLYIL